MKSLSILLLSHFTECFIITLTSRKLPTEIRTLQILSLHQDLVEFNLVGNCASIKQRVGRMSGEWKGNILPRLFTLAYINLFPAIVCNLTSLLESTMVVSRTSSAACCIHLCAKQRRILNYVFSQCKGGTKANKFTQF